VKICYVDEAGCCGALPSANSDVQPVLVVAGLIIDYTRLHEATKELLHLKHKFFPGASPSNTTYLGRILGEVKGADLRRDFCCGRRKNRATKGFLNGVLNICGNADARLVGRIWIKEPGASFDGRSVYASSLQAIAEYYHDYLARADDLGMIVADSRTASLNSQMSHSIFTQKFKSSGDDFDRIIDLPTFGHSDNHAGLQIVDALCSAIIFPIAAHTYCTGLIRSVHLRPKYAELKAQYIEKIEAMQHRYKEASGRWRGGLVVSDAMTKRSGKLFFEVPPSEAAVEASLFTRAA